MNEKCNHEDGWVVKEEFVIGVRGREGEIYSDDNIEVEVECNTLGCCERKIIRFDVINVTDLKYTKSMVLTRRKK